jgi:hypothetical protein
MKRQDLLQLFVVGKLCQILSGSGTGAGTGTGTKTLPNSESEPQQIITFPLHNTDLE